ncbi:MAG TPA: hypothetical protein PLP16_07540 [Smithellaceae bacterium]|nr:hypothetical protein [Smithellaceae bacterium]
MTKEKKVSALRKVVNPKAVKVDLDGKDAGGGWAIAIGIAGTFCVPKSK